MTTTMATAIIALIGALTAYIKAHSISAIVFYLTATPADTDISFLTIPGIRLLLI